MWYRVGIELRKGDYAHNKAAIYWPSDATTLYEFEAKNDVDAYRYLCATVLPDDERPISGRDYLKNLHGQNR